MNSVDSVAHLQSFVPFYREGKWKIVAKFDNLKENTYSANFEVKKYGMYTNLTQLELARKCKVLKLSKNRLKTKYTIHIYVNFTKTLSVLELPAFNVTLVPKKYHLSLEDTELEVKVYAK